MIAVFILGIVGGLDDLQVSSAVGLMGLERKRRWALVAPFMFFDALMTLAGLLIGHKLSTRFEDVAHLLGPAIILVLGIYILVQELTGNENQNLLPELANSRWLRLGLPLLMSIDNLFAGLGLGTAGYPVVPATMIVALCSGLMCLIGLVIGKKVRALIPMKIEIVSGIYLIGLSVFLYIK